MRIITRLATVIGELESSNGSEIEVKVQRLHTRTDWSRLQPLNEEDDSHDLQWKILSIT